MGVGFSAAFISPAIGCLLLLLLALLLWRDVADARGRSINVATVSFNMIGRSGNPFDTHAPRHVRTLLLIEVSGNSTNAT
jgi:hypothetical protein